ncbi:MAG TPA: alpha-1,2-fucosyltransferase [Bacteroidales bacterium]
MLTFSRLGNAGRLGNQLFQIAFITAFAERHRIEYKLPYWDYAPFFDFNFNFSDTIDNMKFDLIIKERPGLGYQEKHFVQYLPQMKASNVNIISGFFQSYKYFEKQHVLYVFKPKKKIKLNIKKCMAISIRRGDFVRSKLYNNIEAQTYRFLLKSFKGYKVFVFSDDYNYCKNEFIGNQYEFLEGLNAIEQLLMMRLFDCFILSNSTFSYWGPMLNPDPKVVLFPQNMFTDLNLNKVFIRDYWPNSPNYIGYNNPITKSITTS